MGAAILLRLLFLLSTILMVSPIAFAEHNHLKDKTKIIFGVHPYLPAPELKKRFKPIIDHLEKHLMVNVELQVSQNYEIHIEHVANGAVDIAFMGPSSYVTLTTKHGEHPLLTRLEVNGKPYLYGNIIVRTDSGLTDIKQLAGKSFAFGSPHSTMSYIVPRSILNENGVALDRLAEYKFLGNHRNVAIGVLLGDFDAGAVKQEVFHKFKDKGLVSIAKTPAISEHLFVARNNFPAPRLEAIRNLMLELSNTEEGINILKKIKSSATGLVSVNHGDYKALTRLMNNK